MIRLKVNGDVIDFTTSVFPDGTSQVWKLSRDVKDATYVKIDFVWENKESEVLQLLQLIDLVRQSGNEPYINLNMPYLPYARQDKDVSSETTFALHSFANLLNSKKIDQITSFDIHSKVAKKLIKNLHNIKPDEFHLKSYNRFKADEIFYPDAGAASRYSLGINHIQLFGEKVRNQLTGVIDRYRLVNKNSFDLNGKRILIVDDLCDGGATFIMAVKALQEFNPSCIGLCVSHGVFSKGLEEMKAAGISEFYYTNSLVKNKDGFNIYE